MTKTAQSRTVLDRAILATAAGQRAGLVRQHPGAKRTT